MNWSWQQYQQYLKSEKWQIKRKEILARAAGKCEKCGKSEVWDSITLQVHHIHYKTLGNERPEDLQALCLDCHKTADTNRKIQNQNKRVDAWASKVYGDEWYDYQDSEQVADRFYDWLDSKND